MSTKASSKEKASRAPAVSRAYEIASQLESDIISGKRKPRERLVELELAAQFGASRAPVREALRLLEREGLVTSGFRGAQVTAITPEEVADIFEILANLEELYTCRATPHVAPEALRDLEHVLAEMARAVTANDVPRYFDLNISFHHVIREACPNRWLIKLLESLGKQTLRYRHLAMSLPGRLPVSLEEHQQIWEALTQRDSAAAGQRARISAERAYTALIDLLKQNPQLL